MRFTWAGGTDVGLAREKNEDAYYPDQDGSGPGPLLFAAADGLGGLPAGELASRTAVDSSVAADGSPEDRVRAANRAVVEAGIRRFGRPAEIGATLTLAQIDPGGLLTLGHVGDSRAYLLRGGKMEQLTVDHTAAQELVSRGVITEEQARFDPNRSILTRAVGLERNVEVDVIEKQLEAGDRLLLCSDGLNEMMEDDRIAAVLGAGPPPAAVRNLIEAANQAGGSDNITAVVVEAEADRPGSEDER